MGSTKSTMRNTVINALSQNTDCTAKTSVVQEQNFGNLLIEGCSDSSININQSGTGGASCDLSSFTKTITDLVLDNKLEPGLFPALDTSETDVINSVDISRYIDTRCKAYSDVSQKVNVGDLVIRGPPCDNNHIDFVQFANPVSACGIQAVFEAIDNSKVSNEVKRDYTWLYIIAAVIVVVLILVLALKSKS